MLSRNTIKNIKDVSYTGLITFSSPVTEFHLDYCSFINKGTTQDNCGGYGLWISRDEAQPRPLINIVFSNCIWDNNQAKASLGGAIHQGKTSSLYNASMKFLNCTFRNNKATEGGAVALEIIQDASFDNCKFYNNIAESGKGGAIFVDPEFPGHPTSKENLMKLCLITNCVFEGNNAKDNGHALYIKGTDTEFTIESSNYFKNNGESKSLILSECQKLFYLMPTIEYNDYYKAPRPLEFSTNSIVIFEDITFNNYKSKEQEGNSILISNGCRSATFINCKFIDCGNGNQGYTLAINDGEIGIENCKFIFNNLEQACCALKITTYNKIIIQNCLFEKTNNRYDNNLGASFYYQPTNGDPLKENFVFHNNTFNYCEGKNFRTYSIVTQKSPQFSFITIQNSQIGAYICQIQINKIDSFTFDHCAFINMTTNSDYGGGSGMWLLRSSRTDFKAIFDSCKWENNYAKSSQEFNGIGGGFQHGFTESTYKAELTFTKCQFIRNKSDREGGALAIQATHPCLIDQCLFEGNVAGCEVKSRVTFLSEKTGFGGALFIDTEFNPSILPMSRFDITNSIFISNQAIDGHAIYIRRCEKPIINIGTNNVFTDNGNSGCTILNGAKNIIINNSVIFNFTDLNRVSRPIDYEANEDIIAKYENMKFENLGSTTDGTGNAIHIKNGMNSAIIRNCVFHNCGIKGYVITVETHPLEFFNNTIIFDDQNKACKGLGIFVKGEINIEKSFFSKCNCFSETEVAAGILYKPTITTSYNENVIFNDNTFSELFGDNDVCFKIQVDGRSFESKNITVQNISTTGYICSFKFAGTTNKFEFNDYKFLYNSASSELGGGGCGLSISREQPDSDITLEFYNCNWTFNKANGQGGAFSPSNEKTKLSFEECIFSNNTAGKEGGALAIQTTENCKINRCKFYSNLASLKGGAIFINGKTGKPVFTISECYFEENHGEDGHAISITGNDASIFDINNYNVFTNNGGNSGAVLYSIAPNINIRDVEFNFTDSGSKSRAITLAVNAKITLTRIIFRKCQSLTGNGGAIYFDSGSSYKKSILADQTYQIENCQFYNCKVLQGNGGSIYAGNGVSKLVIRSTLFEGGSVGADGEGASIYLASGVLEAIINDDVVFKDIFNSDKYIIGTECKDFTVQNIKISYEETLIGAKGIILRGGRAKIENIVFNKCIGCIKVDKETKEATINNCIFTDCLSKGDCINIIRNAICTFSNNIINYTNNNQASRALEINSKGKIIILNNKFFRCYGADRTGVLTVRNQKDNQFDEDDLKINYNTIEECSGGYFGIFNIDSDFVFNFDHNILKNCNVNEYACQLNPRYTKDFVLSNFSLIGCQSNCEFGGGLGVWIKFGDGQGKLTFNKCIFNENIANGGKYLTGGYNGGAFSLGHGSNRAIELVFKECSFTENKAGNNGGALSIDSSKPVLIEKCNFTRNYAGYDPSQKEGFGGAIFIDPDIKEAMESISILNCIFDSNIGKDKKGHCIYIKGGIKTKILISDNCTFIDNGVEAESKGYSIYSESHNLEFSNSIMKYTDIYKSCSGFKLSGEGTTIIKNCYFFLIGYRPEENANVIKIEPTTTSVIIDSCNFDTCGANGAKYTIIDEGKSTKVNNCNFYVSQLDGRNLQTCAYSVRSIGIHTFTNCNISNSWADSGCVKYKPEIITGVGEAFTFQNILFDSLYGGDRLAIDFTLSNSTFKIDHVTIQNCKNRNVFVGLEIISVLKEFVFDNFNFINNENQNKHGGGSGIWLDLKDERSIIFSNCLFKGNHNYGSNEYGNGGGIQLGYAGNPSYAKVSITNCIFENNIAESAGGAICIQTNYPLVIEDCTFITNTAKTSGGAIYIDPDYISPNNRKVMETALISNCIFKGNEGSIDGQSIYLKGGEKTKIEIMNNCKFTDNKAGDKNIIRSECSDLKIYDIYFEFQEIWQSSRAIFLAAPAKSEIYNCRFIRCAVGGDGAAIKIEKGTQGTKVLNNYFEDIGNSGWAITCYGTPLLFENNTVRYTNSENAGGALKVDTTGGQIEVYNCVFDTTKTSKDEFGALRIKSGGNDEKITIGNNLFMNCYGENQRCFSVTVQKPFRFYNNTIKNCPLGNYLGSIDFAGSATEKDEFIFEKCKWINNKCNSPYGGGAGLWLANNRNKMKFTFTECEFSKNSQSNNGGAFQDGSSPTINNKELKFISCMFVENEANKSGGALSIEIIEPFEINSCTFTSNKAQNGGAVYINGESSLKSAILTKNIFVSNTAKNGSVIYISNSINAVIKIDGNNKLSNKGETGSLITSQCGSLYINDATFDFVPTSDTIKRNFTAIELLENSGTTITNCSFVNNDFTTNSNRGNAITAYIASYVSIVKSTFTDCGSSRNRYVISSLSKVFIFENSQISFSNSASSCGGIVVYHFSTLALTNSIIKNCNITTSEGGGLFYGLNGGDNSKCNVSIVGCTFQNCHSNNGRALRGNLAKFSIFKNNTIKDMADGTYIMVWGHIVGQQGQTIMENVRFENNKCNTDQGGGGIGLWYTQTSKLTFQDCQFINNVCTNNKANGGVLGYGTMKSIQDVELEFISCIFEDNEVQSGCNGSALCFQSPNKPATVIKCIFKDKKALASYGGAIYIRSNAQPVTITGCTFYSIKAKTTGNAIYIERETTSATISDSTFNDCGTGGSVIYSQGKKLDIQGSSIIFSKSAYGSAARGIELQARSIFSLKDSIIKNCAISDSGAGFLYCNWQPIAFEEKITLENVIFENCLGSNGRALFGSSHVAAKFKNITIQNILNEGNYIFTWGHDINNKVSKVVLENCKFINLSCKTSDKDGGGLGLWLSDTNEIEFNGCEFINLKSAYNGGALSFFTSTERLRDTKLTFYKCIFDKNTGGNDYNGSALCLNVIKPINISYCNFTNNQIKGNGGSIYIVSRNIEVNIEFSEFYLNKEIGSGNGNALFLETGLTKTIINRCKFIDCGTSGSVIITNAKEIILSQSTIEFTVDNSGARGIYGKQSAIFTVLNTTFKGCVNMIETGGGAIFYEGDTSSGQPEAFSITDCIFDNNKAKNGCAMYIQINGIPVIAGITVKNHNNGKFICTIFYRSQILEETKIENSIFEYNHYTSATTSQPDGGGCAIWVSSLQGGNTVPYPLTFKGCTFQNNRANLCGGAIAYGQSNNLMNTLLSFTQCNFLNNVADGKEGGALWINTQVTCTVEGCIFRRNINSNADDTVSNALCFKSRSRAVIVDTTFIDNGIAGSAIVFEGVQFSMEASIIEFVNNTIGTRGILFYNKAEIEIIDSNFLKCNAGGNWGGGIYYQEKILSSNKLSFVLEGCTFDNNTAGNGNALLLDITATPEIRGCTIKNHQNGGFIFVIFFVIFHNNFEITDCTFELNKFNNNDNAEDGGGAGIWIANSKDIAAGRNIQIYFIDCAFRGNTASTSGGAFAYGRSPTVSGTEISFEACKFDGNTAKKGGALWMGVASPINIENCHFKNNYASEKAASIYSDTSSPICSITGSSFSFEYALRDGNAVYSTSKTLRIILTDNTFENCAQREVSSINVISIESVIVGFYNNLVIFSTYDEACRGLNLQAAGIIEVVGSRFMMNKPNTGKGGGLLYTNSLNSIEEEEIKISQCIFESCVAEDGNGFYLELSVMPVVSENMIKGNKIGRNIATIIFKQTISDFAFNGWTFINNKGFNSANDEDGGGSGIKIQNLDGKSMNYTFFNCTWTNNESPYAGGAYALGRNQIYKNSNLIFDSCTFVKNSCGGEMAGALWLSTNANIIITNCNFTNNKGLGTNSLGGAIYFDQSSTATVQIVNTYFTKNYGMDANVIFLSENMKSVLIDGCNIVNNGNLGSAIKVKCNNLTISNSFIGFDAYSLSTRGIECSKKCLLSIFKCNISHCKADDDGALDQNHGGGLLYNTDSDSSSNEEQIIIEDTIFDSCYGINGATLMIWISKSIIFNRNTIENCRKGPFIFTLITSTYVEEYVLEECIFRQNSFTSQVGAEDGGGSGLWIANNKDKVPVGSHTCIIFRKCKWIQNSATTVGGALAYGRSATLVNTDLIFDTCAFTDNMAKGQEAGALWIMTKAQIVIKDCMFQNNRATGTGAKGGAIVINSASSSINIAGCNFKSNTAKDGNAIFVKQDTKDINISECTLDDCGTYESVIRIESSSCCVDSCYIKFSTSKACRGLCFPVKCDAIVKDTHFINCIISGNGGGIYYSNDIGIINDEANLIIEGCLFNKCQSSNGCAIFCWLDSAIILRNNLIWFNTKGNYIISVFYSKYVNETIIEDCYFEHNSFSGIGDGLDGGGSGIWIAHQKGLVDDSTIKKLKFVSCTWNNNTAAAFGGAFAYGKSATLQAMDLEFDSCNFMNNTAKNEYGGALYIITKNPLIILDCFFDGNRAGKRGGAVYFSKYGDVKIEDSRFARNIADEAGAIYADGQNKVFIDSNIFSENEANNGVPNLYLKACCATGALHNVINNKFKFNRVLGQYQIYLTGNLDHNVTFKGNCFTHSGDNEETVTHIKSDITGSIILGEGNCFDTPEEISIKYSNETSTLTIFEGIFDCMNCIVPTIPPTLPTNIPTSSPMPTPLATLTPTSGFPDPTPKPTLDGETDKPVLPTVSAITTTNLETLTTTSINEDSDSDKGNSKNVKQIGMIVGIVLAVVVILVFASVIVWLLVCRNRANNQQVDESQTRSVEMNTETNSSISEVKNDDPIWSMNSQDNPLFEGNENNDEEAFGDVNAIKDDFEENWNM